MNQTDNKPIFLIGSGGHASVLEEIISLTGKKLLGILDPNRKPGEKCFNTVVLGGDEIIEKYSRSRSVSAPRIQTKKL